VNQTFDFRTKKEINAYESKKKKRTRERKSKNDSREMWRIMSGDRKDI